MAGPLGPLGPTVDPNWAYNTPAWSSQANTGDVEGTGIVQGTISELVEPAALSGYITRTMDPDVSSAGVQTGSVGTVSGTAYLAAVQILQPAVSTKVNINVKTIPVTPTYSAIALFSSVTGQRLAITSTTSTNFNTTGGVAGGVLNWTTPAVLSSGYYWAVLLSIAATGVILQGFPLAGESQALLTGTGVLNYTVGSSLRFATGSTNLTGLAAMPTALTAAMVVSATASSWFAGIA
jgi:hypothetical protein